jgi:uncharacterized membrane protein
MIVGIIFLILMVSLNYVMVGEGRAQVSFTYTAPVTKKSVSPEDTTEFISTLKNTGSGSDTYDVDRIDKPPTPEDWWIRFCTGDVCWDPEVTHAEMSLNPGESDQIKLHMAPTGYGTGIVTMLVTSQTNPSVKDSITFTLRSTEQTPVTNRWGLIFFIILISGSGLYLILRRL